MASENPYDRRRERASVLRIGEVNLGETYNILDDGRRAYPGFGLARLEEVMRDEYARGYNCGEGTMERRMDEEILPGVRRRTWDEGRAAGLEDGREKLLGDIAERWERRIEEARSDIANTLATQDLKQADLMTMLASVHKLLGGLQHDHHEGFQDAPF